MKRNSSTTNIQIDKNQEENWKKLHILHFGQVRLLKNDA